MLVPVPSVISSASHARADRYTYLPQIGVDIALVWSVLATLPGVAGPAVDAWPRFGCRAGGLMACTWRQTGFWQDDNAVGTRLGLRSENAMAHFDLGLLLEEEDEASAGALSARLGTWSE